MRQPLDQATVVRTHRCSHENLTCLWQVFHRQRLRGIFVERQNRYANIDVGLCNRRIETMTCHILLGLVKAYIVRFSTKELSVSQNLVCQNLEPDDYPNQLGQTVGMLVFAIRRMSVARTNSLPNCGSLSRTSRKDLLETMKPQKNFSSQSPSMNIETDQSRHAEVGRTLTTHNWLPAKWIRRNLSNLNSERY